MGEDKELVDEVHTVSVREEEEGRGVGSERKWEGGEEQSDGRKSGLCVWGALRCRPIIVPELQMRTRKNLRNLRRIDDGACWRCVDWWSVWAHTTMV